MPVLLKRQEKRTRVGRAKSGLGVRIALGASNALHAHVYSPVQQYTYTCVKHAILVPFKSKQNANPSHSHGSLACTRESKRKRLFNASELQPLTHQSGAHVEAHIVRRVHNRVRQTDVESVAEHRDAERSAQMRLIETRKSPSRETLPEHGGGQITAETKPSVIKVQHCMCGSGPTACDRCCRRTGPHRSLPVPFPGAHTSACSAYSWTSCAADPSARCTAAAVRCTPAPARSSARILSVQIWPGERRVILLCFIFTLSPAQDAPAPIYTRACTVYV